MEKENPEKVKLPDCDACGQPIKMHAKHSEIFHEKDEIYVHHKCLKGKTIEQYIEDKKK